MVLQEFGDPLCRRVLVLHPHRQRLQTLQQRPRVERTQGRTRVPHQLLHGLVNVLLVAQNRPAEHPALSIDVLGARIDHHVDTQRKALLQDRCSKHIVQHHFCTGSVREIAYRGDVDQRLHRVGRRLEEHCLRGHRQRLFPLRQVVAVDEHGLHTPARRISLHTTKHDPNRLRAATNRSPAASSAPSEVKTAAIPVAVAKHAGAPSISRSRSSNIEIVGLPYREYT